MNRRDFLWQAMAAAWMSAAPPAGASPQATMRAIGDRLRLRTSPQRGRAPQGGLQPPDANGLRLLPGFTARVVARSGQSPVPGGNHAWHAAPDGGATFPVSGGGWIYVSNAEVGAGQGGCSALRFASNGAIVAAYAILSGTSVNCAGGATPWGTWISCEETDSGHAWECDPFGVQPALRRAALGTFKHEAVAVDPIARCVYLTEDEVDGRFYRFTPAVWPDLGAGRLDVAEAIGPDATMPRSVNWHAVPNPNPRSGSDEIPTRLQIVQSTAFSGGEGIYFHNGFVFFSAKGENRIYRYDTQAGMLAIFYDDAWFASPVLTGVDNVLVDAAGRVYVAEDAGDMQIVMLAPTGQVLPLLQVVGHEASEITGLAFSPDGARLYFSSQRGATGLSGDGVTYEVTGPFPAMDGLFRAGFENAIRS